MIKAHSERFCLTPNYTPFYLTGYKTPIRKLPAQGVHDDIYGQVSLFDADGKYLFIFSTDWISVEEEMYEELADKLHNKFAIDKKMVLITATHNHQSTGDQMKKNEHFNQEYYDWILETVIDLYQKCLDNLEEVEAYYGKKIITGYYASRILDNTLADNEVIMLELKNAKNEVVSAICNWAVHSTALTPENALLTAEFAGNTAKQYQLIKGYYPHMVVGAAGDCSTRPTRQGNDYNELDRISKGMAKEIATIEVNNKININFESVSSIEHHFDVLIDHDYIDKQIELTKEELNQDNLSFDRKKVLNSMLPALDRLNSLDHVKADWYAHDIKLGELEIVVSPSELASKFGIEIKDKSKAKCCLVFGYTNGRVGYLFPEELYGLTFETISSGIPAKEVREYIDKILGMI